MRVYKLGKESANGSCRCVFRVMKRDKNGKRSYGSKLRTAIAVALSTAFLLPGKASADSDILRVGDKGEKVEELQRSLRVLELYEYPELEGFFGADTRSALMNFQRAHGLEVNGIADADTFEAMDKALDEFYPEINYIRTMRLKTVGEDVRALQQVLKTMGYYGTRPDGIFNANTASAVRTFQFDYGMAVDGVVNERLVKKINSVAATLRPLREPTQEQIDASLPETENDIAQAEDRKYRTDAVKMQWSAVDKIWQQGRALKVTDIETGISFMLTRTGGINHADVEPCTEADTENLREVFSGAWSWQRRPVIVEISYITSAASVCGMPHGESNIFGNGVSGHFCMHFFESTDDDGYDMTDKAHQRAIDVASEYSFSVQTEQI